MTVEDSVREPLAGYPVLRSHAVDEVRDISGRLFTPHRLDVTKPHDRLDTLLNAVQLGDITLGYVRYGAGVRILVEEMRGSYQVNIPLRGRMAISGHRETFTSTPERPAVMLPGGRYLGHWTGDCEQLAVNIDHAALEAELERQLGRPVAAPIRFDFAMDGQGSLAQSWLAAVRLVTAECGRRASLVRHPRAIQYVQNLIATGLLLGHPHNYSAALSGPHPTSGPRAVKQAVDIIEDRPEQPLTASALASAVGVSVRALQEGFRRYVGLPPMSYLREVRLARVHAELVASGPGTVTVTEVACRWGFVHLGRFAAAYQRKYGVRPSGTLHAGRAAGREAGPGGADDARSGLFRARNG